MGGDVAAESVLGAGATFRVWFRAPACAAPPSQAHSSGALPSLAGRRVLVADDNALVRELFVESLREAGAQCTVAGDGEQALAAAEQGCFDAVVLDLSMPRIDGIEVTQRLRAAQRDVRIIGVSAHAGEREKEDAITAGMDVFLVKPVSLSVLLSAITAQPGERAVPVDNTAALIQRLRERFCDLAAEEGAALASAIAEGDFSVTCVRAHHLMNSAAVVRDDVLFEACVCTERAARNQDTAELEAAWIACEAALKPWMSRSGEKFLSAKKT
jgi:CheY-like chemotaxis protein